MTVAEIIRFCKIELETVIGKDVYLADEKRFRLDDEAISFSTKHYKWAFGRAIFLVGRMFEGGATREEIDRAVRYIHIIANSEAKRLNDTKASDEFGIYELMKKYPVVKH